MTCLIWSSPAGPPPADCAAAGRARLRTASEMAIKLTRRILGSGMGTGEGGHNSSRPVAKNARRAFRFCDRTTLGRPLPRRPRRPATGRPRQGIPASGRGLLLQLCEEVVEILGADLLELGKDALQAAPTMPLTVVLAA